MSPDCKKSNYLYVKSDYSLLHDCELEVENKPTSQGLSVEANLGVCGILRCKKNLGFSSFY